MKRLLLWAAVPLLLLGAAMLIADIGATALWIAVIAVGIALVVIGQNEAESHGAAVTSPVRRLGSGTFVTIWA
jgi:hypothetical protein